MIASLKEQLDHVEGELKDEQVRVESLTTHLMDSQSKSEELSQQLYSVKQEVKLHTTTHVSIILCKLYTRSCRHMLNKSSCKNLKQSSPNV